MLSQRFISNIYRATRAVNLMVSDVLADGEGLELSEFMILNSIIKECHYPGAIAKRLHASKYAVSRAVQKLLGLGLIEREIDEHDSRRVLLKATPEGVALREGALARLHERIEPLLLSLGEAQAESLIRGLGLIIENSPGEKVTVSGGRA